MVICLEQQRTQVTKNRCRHDRETSLTRCVAMPSLMATHWVGQKSSPIFRCLWTKVHRIKVTCAGVSVVCNAVFLLTMSCCSPKLRQHFDVFGPPNFRGKGPQKLLAEFYKSGSPSNTWQSLVTIGQATSEIRRRKKI